MTKKGYKMAIFTDKAQLTGVWVFNRELVYVRAAINALENGEIDHAAMLRFDGKDWTQYMIRTPGVAHCVIPEDERTVLTLSPFGVVHVAKPAGFSWETLDDTEHGPNSLRQMRDIRPVEDHVFAVGMGRMVYQRSAGGEWERFDQGMRGNRAAIEMSGLLAIDGCSGKCVYAVGFNGEIWQLSGDRWTRVESPTNIKLERVRVISPELIVACGAAGTILVGNADRWRVIPQQLTKRTLWGLEYFQERFYFADTTRIYSLEGEELSTVDLTELGPVSTSRLHAADGVLWSVGGNDIVVFDGKSWKRQTLN